MKYQIKMLQKSVEKSLKILIKILISINLYVSKSKVPNFRFQEESKEVTSNRLKNDIEENKFIHKLTIQRAVTTTQSMLIKILSFLKYNSQFEFLIMT